MATGYSVTIPRKRDVERSYNLYAEPTHQEVERAARRAVRETIDQKLYRDASQLSEQLAARRPTADGPIN